MTVQRNDYLLVDGERRRIAAAAPMPFAPNAFGLRLQGSPAADCERAFWIDFKIDGNTFWINELWLSPHTGDRESLFHGRLFNRVPDNANQSSMTFKDIPLPYSGKLITDINGKSTSIAVGKLKEIFGFENGTLVSREEMALAELPEGFTPSSVWRDYGVMLWILPDQSEWEAT